MATTAAIAEDIVLISSACLFAHYALVSAYFARRHTGLVTSPI